MARHKIFEKQTEVVDQSTGEVLGKVTTEKKFVYEVESDKFYMVFIDVMSPEYGLKNSTSRDVLKWMCSNAEYNTGIVYLPGPRLNELSEFINSPKQTVYNSINQLKKLGLITGERGVFRINPELFWRGDLQARRQLLESNGGKFSVTFSIAPNVDFDGNASDS